MDIWYSDSFTVPLCRLHSDKVFVFGDNTVKQGKGGQAIIRDEPNAFGIPTKKFPHRLDSAYFSDLPEEWETVEKHLRKLWVIAQTKSIVFPVGGIGTGLAMMEHFSPLIYRDMCEILLTHFGITNGEGGRMLCE